MESYGIRRLKRKKTNAAITVYYDDFGCLAVHTPSGQYAFGDAADDAYDNLLRTLGREGMRRPKGRQWYTARSMGRYMWKIDTF